VVKIQSVKARFQNFFLQFMGIYTTIISILYIHDNSEEKLHFLIAKKCSIRRELVNQAHFITAMSLQILQTILQFFKQKSTGVSHLSGFSSIYLLFQAYLIMFTNRGDE